MIRRVALLLLPAALLVLPACGGGDGTAETGSSPSAASSTASASASGSDSSPEASTQNVVEVSVAVRDGKVSPKSHRVDVPKDSQVRLIVTSDVDDALHVHGYEIEEELEAGRPTTVEFVADQQGVFEAETHETELQLLQLEVR